MKKIVLVIMGLFYLAVSVSAYQVNIDAPETLTVGKPLIVTGTTTFGIGTPIDVVLYFQLTTSTEIYRKIAYVQSDRSFRVIFDTTGLKKGQYKVEVPVNGLGDSTTMRVVNLVDRSDEIQLTSGLEQYFTGTMYVAGILANARNSGFQIEVFDADNSPIFGPNYINTNSVGAFSADVPIPGPGEYEISFTDSQGYVGSRMIEVLSREIPATATIVTTAVSVVSAHTKSSQDSPAYFTVRPPPGPVTLRTSSGIDWVLEYVDEQGIRHSVNKQGNQKPETVDLQSKGKTIYVKIYPAKSGVSSEAFLYVENGNSVMVSATVPAAFGTPTSSATETPQSPLSPLAGILAIGLVGFLFYCRK